MLLHNHKILEGLDIINCHTNVCVSAVIDRAVLIASDYFGHFIGGSMSLMPVDVVIMCSENQNI